MKKPLRVFYSYSHKDEKYLDELKAHLAPLRDQKFIEDWYDRMIPAGSTWESQIANEMETADIFLMIISSNFLSSNYCYEVEMQKALEKAHKNECLSIPIIIRECLWDFTPLKKLQALPTDGIPVQSWQNRDKAWKNVAEGLLNAIKKFSGTPTDKSKNVSSANPEEGIGDPVETIIIQNIETTERIEPLVLGRGDEILGLINTLQEAHKPVTITSGFGGIGKSTLALKVAWHFYNQKKPFNLIAFVDCRTYGGDEKQGVTYNFILNEIARIADETDITSSTNLDVKEEQVKKLIKSHRALLIFDNYESLLQYPDEEKRISKFLNSLPVGTNHDNNAFARVMITTRELSEGLKSLPSNNFDVQKMPLNACIEWIRQIAPPNVVLNDNQCQTIWKMFHGLPKYIEIAVDQLGGIPFENWKRITEKYLEKASSPGVNLLFEDLFEQSWNRFSEEYKKILMSITYFIGDTPFDALQWTSGLPEDDYFLILGSISNAYLENTGSKIRIHPLTDKFCQSKLNSKEHSTFRQESQNRFVEYYLQFARKACQSKDYDAQEKEIRNIIAAVHLAKKLQAWKSIIEFSENILIRHRGYWSEQLDISQAATEASRQLGDKQKLAHFLVHDLGWLYLRFEDIEKAKNSVTEGLELFALNKDKEGSSLATRHLGKIALIEGLDDYYEPILDFDRFSSLAEKYYQESLDIRLELAKQSEEQKRAIADLYLDFGRLFWLQGKWAEKRSSTEDGSDLSDYAYKKYQEANEITQKAKKLFEEMKLEQGIVKSWGNLGNATKEIAKFALHKNNLELAFETLNQAHHYYVQNSEGGISIGRKDEISHGYWGLAEIYKLFAENSKSSEFSDDTATLLQKALWYAEESHTIYTSLGGIKDINATSVLVNTIKESLKIDQ